MATKRTASSELNHENWNAEDEKEDPGTFKPLTGSDLQTRVIRKARRSLKSEPSDSPFKAASPFAAFSGFASGSSPTPFSFLKKSNSSDGNIPSKPDTPKELKKENGNSITHKEKNPVEELTDVKKPSSIYVTSPKEKAARNIEYFRQLQSLNESVLKWMQLHLSKNSCSDFTPVFNDYKKHLDTLNVTYPVKKKEALPSEDKHIFKRPASFGDKSPKSTTDNARVNFAFKPNSKDDETDYGAHFSSNTTNTSTFSFGIKRTPTATSSGSPMGPTTSLKDQDSANFFSNTTNTSTFSFGSKGIPTTTTTSSPLGPTTSLKVEDGESGKKPPFQFSFGLKYMQASENVNKPFSFAAVAATKTAESVATEEQEYVPPKNDFVAVSEEDALYSKRCKLFFKKDDTYAEKGVGTLYVKPLDGKTQLLIRADTNLGNILLNILLSATLPMSRTGKNNVLLVCVPNPPLDAKNPDSKEAIPILIRVKTSEDADELLETLNKYKV